MPNDSKNPSSAQLAAYQVLAARRLGYDTLIWQTPALGLTAQAFLFTAALGHDTSRTARFIAGFLALVTSVISMQLMKKHRYHEMIDSHLLRKFEDQFSIDPLHAIPRERANRVNIKPSWPERLSSYSVWMCGLALFALAALSLIAITLACPELL